MNEEQDLTESALSRRKLLTRGAIAGGLVWAAPAVTTVGGRVFAQVSPVGQDISFIGLNIQCADGAVTTTYVIKFEGCSNSDCFEQDPGNFPDCDGVFTPSGTPADGDDLGFTVTGPDAQGCVHITVPENCEVLSSAIKGGQVCCAGPAGTGVLTFCPCP